MGSRYCDAEPVFSIQKGDNSDLTNSANQRVGVSECRSNLVLHCGISEGVDSASQGDVIKRSPVTRTQSLQPEPQIASEASGIRLSKCLHGVAIWDIIAPWIFVSCCFCFLKPFTTLFRWTCIAARPAIISPFHFARGNYGVSYVQNFRMIIFLCGCVLLCRVAGLEANELTASQLLPETTVGYVEITDTAAIMTALYDHPLSLHIQEMEAWKTATKTEQYRAFLTGRKFFEIQIGSDWRPAIEGIIAGGIYAAFDAATEGVVILIRTKDEATAENFRLKILELTQLNEATNGKAEPYRDVKIYKTDKNSGAAVVGNWIVVTNNGELGKGVLDRLLEESSLAPDAEVSGTLSANAQFKATYAKRSADSQAWAYGNIQAVRDAGGAKKLFDGKAENPLVELFVGGIQSVLQHAPFVTADLKVANSGVSLQLTTPCQDGWIPEERQYYFGTNTEGSAPVLPGVPDTLMTLATYRDVSQMWLRAGDLFDEQMNDKLAEAESGLSTIFAGRDFGEEVLGAIQPQIGFIVARESFKNVTPVPALKLPAFALVLKLRDAENMRPELRRTFQSVIGFLNIVGAMEGRPQLELDMEKSGNVDLVTSRYVPEKKDKDSTTADMIFNFSPSAAFSGDQFVLSSTAALARLLAESPETVASNSGINTAVDLHSTAIREALNENREQLISQNMLSEGHSREEAEAAIDLLLEAVRCIKGAGLTLRREDDLLTLKLNVTVNETP